LSQGPRVANERNLVKLPNKALRFWCKPSHCFAAPHSEIALLRGAIRFDLLLLSERTHELNRAAAGNVPSLRVISLLGRLPEKGREKRVVFLDMGKKGLSSLTVKNQHLRFPADRWLSKTRIRRHENCSSAPYGWLCREYFMRFHFTLADESLASRLKPEGDEEEGRGHALTGFHIANLRWPI
jgi:hypothetical protein